jgi:hypothetical protein
MEKKHQNQTVTYGDITLSANQICAFCNTSYNALDQIPTAHCVCATCWPVEKTAEIEARGYAAVPTQIVRQFIQAS